MNAKILVADDELNITEVCQRYLEREGYTVYTAKDGVEAIEKWREVQPDLVVLDLMMPRKDGWQVCEEIQHEQDIPIIMLTARSDEMDRLMGLTIGADDYITKPFSPRELVLRVKAVLRRLSRAATTKNTASAPSNEAITYPGIIINSSQRTVEVEGREVDLTVKEFDMLYLLASHPDQVFSRNQLLNKVWDISYEGDTTTVTVHVRRIREKIESNPSDPQWIKTVWGIGYKFEGRNRG